MYFVDRQQRHQVARWHDSMMLYLLHPTVALLWVKAFAVARTIRLLQEERAGTGLGAKTWVSQGTAGQVDEQVSPIALGMLNMRWAGTL